MKRRQFLAALAAGAAIVGGAAVTQAAPRGPGGQGGPGGPGGQVTAVSGSTITVSTPDGTSVSILTTGTTTFTLDGAASSLSAIKAGLWLHAEGTKASDGTFTATKVIASTTQPTRPEGGRGGRGPGGQVTAVSGSTITVSTPDGTSVSILTTGTTTFTLDGASSSLSALKAGLWVHAEGTKASDGTFTATKVIASTTQPTKPEGGPGGRGPGGQVTAVSGSTITVSTRDGASVSILTTSTTTFTLDGAASSLSAIKAGLWLHAEGTKASDGTFTATKVIASTTQPTPPQGGRGARP